MPTSGVFSITPKEQRYRLSDHGDRWEKRFWPHLQDLFPNFEPFWQRYIVPLTRRDVDQDIHIRRDISPAWEDLAMCHYSILVHLGAAQETLDRLREQQGPRQSGADSTALPGQIVLAQAFYHLVAAVDVVERLLWSLLLLVPALQELLPPRLRWQEVQRRAGGFYKKDYDRQLRDFRAKGQSVAVHLHSTKDVLAPLVKQLGPQGQRAYSQLEKTDGKARAYRNRFVHDPIQGIVERDGKLFLPRVERMASYTRWSAIFYPEDEHKMDEDFQDAVGRGSTYADNLIKALDSLWFSLLCYLKEALQPWPQAESLGEGGAESVESSPLVSGTDSASRTHSLHVQIRRVAPCHNTRPGQQTGRSRSATKAVVST